MSDPRPLPAGERDSRAAAGRGAEIPLPSPSLPSVAYPSPLQGEGLSDAARRLSAISDTPRLDAELLLVHAIGIPREHLLRADHPIPAAFATLVERRLAHEPIAYITGTRGFWTIDLDVTPDVLIPRPDSETLIEAALAHFGKNGPRTILDLGTGSGALLLAALDQWPEATGVGVDASPGAIAVAQRNADRIAPGRATLRLGDWAEGIGDRFELLLCNPPYVETGAELAPQVRDYEPHAALFAGPDGLDAYRRLAPMLARLIAPGGIGCIEIGARQAAAVTSLFEAEHFSVACRRDLGGRDRCLVIRAK